MSIDNTSHEIYIASSIDMKDIPNKSVNLIITSPPYPMIKMWDEIFKKIDDKIAHALDQNNGNIAFNLMHDYLNSIWEETDRVLNDGGIICINIGDSVRKIGNNFQLYSNHAMIIHKFIKMGYQILPEIIWRKQSNKPTKFMGSGMLPVSAYVTLEHEYILIFRKGRRKFSENEKLIRKKSCFFWEERNQWFSDVWTDLKGISQNLNDKNLRSRSASYPFELPYRIINMYSIYGDTVLDPFLGTGTTSIAAMISGRNSIGYEIDSNFKQLIETNISNIVELSKEVINKRIDQHNKFIEKYINNRDIKYNAINYDFKVISSREINIKFFKIKTIEKSSNAPLKYIVNYS